MQVVEPGSGGERSWFGGGGAPGGRRPVDEETVGTARIKIVLNFGMNDVAVSINRGKR